MLQALRFMMKKTMRFTMRICKGSWSKWEYDEKGNEIYFENSDGCWSKSKHNEKGNVIYYENNKGKIIDERVKELTIEQIENY